MINSTNTYSNYNYTNNCLPNDNYKKVLTWDEYNKAIVNFFFEQLGTYEKPDYVIGIGEDSFIFGNALSRLFGNNVGYVMTDSDGNIADHVSIIKKPCSKEENQGPEIQTKPLQGKVLIVSLTPFQNVEAVIEKINTPFITEIRTAALFEKIAREEVVVPDEIFNNLDLSLLESENLRNLKDEDIYRIARTLFAELCQNPLKKIAVTDVSQIPKMEFSTIQDIVDPSVRNVTWDEYGIMKIQTALRIIQSDMKPDLIIGIARGGLDPAKGCAALLKVPMAVYHTSSYKQAGECKRSQLLLGEHISVARHVKQDIKACLTDDLVDSGVTLEKTKEIMPIKNTHITNVMTAVFFKKPETKVIPDIFIQDVDGRWIVLPDEIFERLNLSEIDAVDLSKMLDVDLTKTLHSEDYLFKKSVLDKIVHLTEEVFAKLPQNPKEVIAPEILKELRVSKML